MKSISEYLNRKPKFKYWLPAVGVFEREVRRFLAVPVQTLLGPLASAFIYFGLFGLSLGKVLEQSEPSLSNGFSYLIFLIPGIMAMETLNSSIQNPTSSFMIAKWSGTIVDLLMAPITPFALWFAYVCGAFVRGLIVATSVFIAGCICTQTILHFNPILLLASIFIGVGIFASLGIVLGIICKTWDQVGIILSFIIQPLIFFSGVFFSFSFLPSWLQFIKYCNPFFYIVSLYRYSILGQADISALLAGGVSLAFFICMFLIAHFVINKKLGVNL